MIKVAKITYSHDPDEDVKRIERGVRRGLKAASVHWRTHFSQKHFTTAGAREYQYQNRTKPYMIRKARVKKHQRPLEWSGTLRKMVLGQFPQPRIKEDGTALTANMVLEVPTYTFYTKTKSGSPSPPKYNELVTTSAVESDAFNEIIASNIDDVMKTSGTPRVASVA